jgi:hypothetical protein
MPCTGRRLRAKRRPWPSRATPRWALPSARAAHRTSPTTGNLAQYPRSLCTGLHVLLGWMGPPTDAVVRAALRQLRRAGEGHRSNSRGRQQHARSRRLRSWPPSAPPRIRPADPTLAHRIRRIARNRPRIAPRRAQRVSPVQAKQPRVERPRARSPAAAIGAAEFLRPTKVECQPAARLFGLWGAESDRGCTRREREWPRNGSGRTHGRLTNFGLRAVGECSPAAATP